MPSNPENDNFIRQFNALRDSYFRSSPSLEDAQYVFRTIMTQMSLTMIGAHTSELASTGGPHQVGPHMGTDIWRDPSLLATAAVLSIVRDQVAPNG